MDEDAKLTSQQSRNSARAVDSNQSCLRVNSNLRVKVTPLKPLVRSYLPSGSALRQLILSQPEEMDALEYVGKVGDWLSLLNMEVAVRKRYMNRLRDSARPTLEES